MSIGQTPATLPPGACLLELAMPLVTAYQRQAVVVALKVICKQTAHVMACIHAPCLRSGLRVAACIELT